MEGGDAPRIPLRRRLALRHVGAMTASLGVSLLMLVGKLTAFGITGSSAIFSDAAESVVHILATAFVAYSLWYAIRPADEGHPYGHGKIAYISTGFEGVLIVIASITILFSATRAFIVGPELRQLGVGMLIIGAAGVVNLALGGYLIWTGRRHRSLVLVSNGRHVLSDMWTSLGALLGVGLVWLTGVVWFDPAVAAAFGLYIGFTGIQMLRHSGRGLMEAVDAGETARLLAQLEQAVDQDMITGFHQVRHRRIQNEVWIEYHLHFPSRISLSDAHARSHDVEDLVAEVFPEDDVYVTAHLEPEEHLEAHPEGHAEPEDPLVAGPREEG